MMIKQLYRFTILLAILGFSFINASAKDGYTIKLKIEDAPEEKVLLCHYFGKAGKVFKDDSVSLNKAGVGMMKSSEKIQGGIYILLFEDRKANMEMILLNGDNFTLQTKKEDMSRYAKFSGKSENNIFYAYQDYLRTYGEGYRILENKLKNSKTKTDSTTIYNKLSDKQDELTAYRKGVVKKNKGTFMAKLFLAVENPVVPEELPMLPDGSGKDSTFPTRYFQQHYWDDYDFQDDRLIYTPIYDPKLETYMDKWVVPTPDSVKKQCDFLLTKAEGAPETFKYTLWRLSRWTETSKIMGMDEAFVHLVENYYMKGKATWLDSTQLAKYIDRAKKIAPNMIGQPAMDLRMRDMNNVVKPLSSVSAPYTMLIFWESDCGHCKKELPKLDSIYKSDLKQYGVKFFAVETSNEVDKWKKFVEEKKLGDGWQHVYDPTRETNFRAFYDVYSTPTIYLLDENKTIVGKRIDHTNVLGLIEFLEKKKKKTNKKK